MTHDDATRQFYQFIWPHRAMVLRTARFLAQQHAEADDLTQETLVKAFKSMSRFDQQSPGGARAWLSAILRNTWIDRMRAAGRQGTTLSVERDELDMAAPSGAPLTLDTSPDALLEQISDQDLITGLQHLPEEIRWTLLLVDVEQMDHEQAAGVLQVPEGTVKSRAHRGRRMLREFLTSRPAVEGRP